MPRFAPVAPPPVRPNPVNLITSSRQPDDETAGRWQEGFAFRPEANVDPSIRDWCTADGSNDDVPGSQPPHGLIETVPWQVDVEDDCSAMGFAGVDYLGRVTRALEAATPKGLEREFWTGAVAQAAGWPNLFLASADAVDVTPTPGTAVDLPEAFNLLEDAIAMCGAGGRGMIHVAAWSTPSYDLIRREGPLLLTARDTVVVSGVGYMGTGPDGGDPSAAGQTWLYATGLVDVRLGDIEVFGQLGRSEQDPGDWLPVSGNGDGAFDPARFSPVLLDRDTNTIVTKARRMVAAAWDGACHFAVLANINPGDV